MVWVETPTNPMMQVVDIAAVCKIAHAHSNVFVVTDNTFSTPYFQRPLDLGSDIVLHSLTKYMNGTKTVQIKLRSIHFKTDARILSLTVPIIKS